MTTSTLSASEYLALTFAFWPDKVRYSATATLGTVTAIIDGQAVQRDCVTVTCFDKRAEAQPSGFVPATEREI